MLQFFVDIFQDPKKGPKSFLSLLAFLFFWIAFMQMINADLWDEVPRFDIPASTFEEIK